MGHNRNCNNLRKTYIFVRLIELKLIRGRRLVFPQITLRKIR